MYDAKPASVPLAAHFMLSKDLCPQSKQDINATKKVPYANAIGYVMIGAYPGAPLESDRKQLVRVARSGVVEWIGGFECAGSRRGLKSGLVAAASSNLDLFYGVGACGLGLSLYLIHIYVTEIKRTLQALWAVGALGSLAAYAAVAQPAGKSLVEYVVENPTAVWFVGPLFAALTGLVFKEGLCYGKLEAGILTFIIPSVLLGHLTGLMDEGTKLTLLGVWMALFVVFAGRKFTQPIKVASLCLLLMSPFLILELHKEFLHLTIFMVE
ncbi:hypothetical protein SASPL_110912 [Salvia splendens]|uniref:Uncharacterized protein n=1 Tax=Salvia splendens TaxID=180675 RepID=A0A8X8Y726_SALSN|nr:hypothetical protein SASPL_110912 [Salvia splendens]